MVKRFFHDAWGEALETGKAMAKQTRQVAPGKMAKAVVEQVSGLSSSSDVSPGLEDLTVKKKTPVQLQKMRQQDAVKSNKRINSTRVDIKRLTIQRYQQIQQKIRQKEQERDQVDLEKEKEKVEEEKQKKQKEQSKKTVQLPSGPRQKGILGIFTKQKKGTAEMKIGKAG